MEEQLKAVIKENLQQERRILLQQVSAHEAVQPGTIPRKEPYGGTEDPVLANEEGVDYEPPANPPPPPIAKSKSDLWMTNSKPLRLDFMFIWKKGVKISAR